MENYYEQHKKWLKTKRGRASTLLNAYNHKDERCGREKGDLTSKWIVEHIFSQPCTHCGESDWHKIGCNRLDNSKPHTMDNVEPCCKECNDKLAKIYFSKPVYQYTLDNQLVKIWPSANEAGRNGFTQSDICSCCNNNFKREGNNIYKGHKWYYKPL